MRFKIFIFLFSLIAFLACKREAISSLNNLDEKKNFTVKKEKKVREKVSQKKSLRIEKDSISSKNTVEFLELYGKQNPESIVKIKTRLGDITIQLYRDTPLHRASFIFLTKIGYFKTTCFHRIVPDFIVQGGNSDHPKTRKLRMKYENYRIPAEIQPNRTHKYGALAAAREWDNNPTKESSPFEFYIIQRKEGSHHLDGEHTIFGEIIDGFETIEKIAKLETDKKEWPIQDVCMQTEIIK